LDYFRTVFKKGLFICLLLLVSAFRAWVQQPIALGQPAPTFTARSIYGDTIQLESFRGSVVLLDFWSSWNGVSRKHNLSTKKIFEKYRAYSLRKKKKFNVIQVSLDTRMDLLSVAISKDNLYWRNHICDFKGWYSPYVNLYDIKRIPANFLIDTAGVIVARDVWENALDEAVKKQLD
jgi:peroxiredoxin